MRYIIQKVEENWGKKIASITFVEFPKNGSYGKLLHEGEGKTYECSIEAVNMLAAELEYDESDAIEYWLVGKVIDIDLVKLGDKELMNKVGNLINWAEVSRLLAGNRSVVSMTRSPKKYEQKVKELTDAVAKWYGSLSNT